MKNNTTRKKSTSKNRAVRKPTPPTSSRPAKQKAQKDYIAMFKRGEINAIQAIAGAMTDAGTDTEVKDFLKAFSAWAASLVEIEFVDYPTPDQMRAHLETILLAIVRDKRIHRKFSTGIRRMRPSMQIPERLGRSRRR